MSGTTRYDFGTRSKMDTPSYDIKSLIEQAKQYALDHYNDSFEMSAFTECYDDEDWEQFITEHECFTWQKLRREIRWTARIRQDRRDEIEGTAF